MLPLPLRDPLFDRKTHGLERWMPMRITSGYLFARYGQRRKQRVTTVYRLIPPNRGVIPGALFGQESVC